MATLHQAPFSDLVLTRHRGGITADHGLRQGVHRNAACLPVAFDPMPIGRLAQVFQQMAQAVITHIQGIDALPAQAAQRVLHALDIRFHRHFPVVAFREDIRQPDHGCPPPTKPPLPPMARERPVQDLRQTHRDHLSDEQGHIVDPLGDHHHIALPKDLPGLFRELYSHDTLLSHAGAPWKRA